MSNDTSYVSQAKTTTIKATSRASVKIRDNFFTVEYSEERIIPDIDDVNIESERAILWDVVNAECDTQVQEIKDAFSGR